jgi:glycosyltransferase involved in cell wall biosynthesis
MKILVCPHVLSIGGSAINAIDLAGAVRDRGHDVLVAATPGPLLERVQQRALPYRPLRAGRTRPSPSVAGQLGRLAASEGVDLVHTYEGYLSVEGYFGVRLRHGIPQVSSVMAHWIGRLPRSVPVIVGTPALQEEGRRSRGDRVWCIEPPVDVDEDTPTLDAGAFRREHGLDDGTPTVVMVTRLDRDLKLEGVRRAVAAVELIERPVRLLIAGGGQGADLVAAEAEEVNRRLRRPAVVLTGPLLDPRPAYAAADVVLGMGSSTLRAMAFGRATIVLALLGFSETVTPQTVDRFLRDGFIGVGDGRREPDDLAARLEAAKSGSSETGADSPATQRLAGRIRALLDDPQERAELGRFGRELVCERFDLRVAVRRLEECYQRTLELAEPRRSLLPEGLTALAWASAGAAKGRLLKTRRRVLAGAP